MGFGKAPEYGAIFMSNSSTLNECFERNLVGLPFPFADFVKEIRAGMVLFIFEYEHRKLYGVLKAVTDGKMDIVPNAYRSSGKKFRAQVRFEVIWRCHPLHEDDFQDAIKDNYYAARKFNFGLSKYQVKDLLRLFLSRNPRIERAIKESKRPLDLEKGKKVVKSDRCLKDENAECVTDVPEKPSVSWNRWISSEEKPGHRDLHSPSISSVDFIPLSSPGHDILEETGDAFSVLPFGKDDQTSSAMSSQIGENGRPPRVKGLYSDSPAKRDSVFSRLVAASIKPVVVEEKEKRKSRRSIPSVHEIMEKLEELHGRRWKKMPRRANREEGDAKMKKGSSVFSRLDFGSKDCIEDKKSASRPREGFQTNKRKRSREVSIRSQGESLNITIQVQMDGDRYPPNKRRAESMCSREKQKEESVAIMNVNKKENMLETTDRESENAIGSTDGERWPMFRNRLDQTIQENVHSFEGSTGSNRTDDYQSGCSNREIVPALILPPAAMAEDSDAAADHEEEGKGGGGFTTTTTTTNVVGVRPVTFLKTYQRRHRRIMSTSTSPMIKAKDIEAYIDDIREECMKSLLPGIKRG